MSDLNTLEAPQVEMITAANDAVQEVVTIEGCASAVITTIDPPFAASDVQTAALVIHDKNPSKETAEETTYLDTFGDMENEPLTMSQIGLKEHAQAVTIEGCAPAVITTVDPVIAAADAQTDPVTAIDSDVLTVDNVDQAEAFALQQLDVNVSSADVSNTMLDPDNLTGDGTVVQINRPKKQKRPQQEQAEQQGEPSAEDKLNALAGKFGKKLIVKTNEPAVLRQGKPMQQRPRVAPTPAEVPAARRQVASLLTDFIQTSHITGLNREEGVDHINIGVSNMSIGRALDPYSRQKSRAGEWTNFIHDSLGEFACIASLIFFLKSPEGEDRNSWRDTWGQILRKRSEKGEFTTVKGLKLIVADAYWQLLKQNGWMISELGKTDLPFTAYFYFGRESVRKQSREALWLIPIVNACRTAIKEKMEYPDFSFFDPSEAI